VEDGAHGGHGEIELEMAMVIPAERGHAVALLHTEPLEGVRELMSPAMEVAVGIAEVRAIGVARGYFVLRELLARTLKDVGERELIVIHHAAADHVASLQGRGVS
jgi:hypothetical protein